MDLPSSSSLSHSSRPGGNPAPFKKNSNEKSKHDTSSDGVSYHNTPLSSAVLSLSSTRHCSTRRYWVSYALLSIAILCPLVVLDILPSDFTKRIAFRASFSQAQKVAEALPSAKLKRVSTTCLAKEPPIWSSAAGDESPSACSTNTIASTGGGRYQPVPLPPRAKRIPRPLTLHNQTTIDHYRWMHDIDTDPDVFKYIHAESNYTNDWLENSQTKKLVHQIGREQEAIAKSIAKQGYIRGVTPTGFSSSAVDSEPTVLFQWYGARRRQQNQVPINKGVEGTRFWDVDAWRYWRDDSDANRDVYLRRKVPLKPKQLEQEMAKLAHTHVAPMTLDKSHDPERFEASTVLEENSKPVIQVVLDVTKLQHERVRKGNGGQFSFGMLEIQPHATVLQPRDGNITEPLNYDPADTILAAYSFDDTGNERYNIRIMSLTEMPRDGYMNAHNMDDGVDEQGDEFPIKTRGHEEDKKESMDQYDHGNGQPEEPSALGPHAFKLDNAGIGSRWVRIGDSLFLYYTQLDHKGIQREVWRVRVQSIDSDSGRVVFAKPQPELVMREDDPMLYLGITQTNDLQYLLIESVGQTTSHVYFLDINNPSANWTLIRKPEPNVMYSVEHHSGYFYIRTNHAGCENFEVVRIPVSVFKSNESDRHGIQSSYPFVFFGGNEPDEKVIPHSADEYLERLEVFVDHFAAWIWRDGMQEIRIFDAPKASAGLSPKLPIKVRHRLRPWRRDTPVATVIPECIRGADDRIYRNYFATHFQFCNSSFIRPWALYEFDMNAPPATHWHMDDEEGEKVNDEIVNNATTLICQDPFPIGVVYGKTDTESGHILEKSLSKIESSISAIKQKIFSALPWNQRVSNPTYPANAKLEMDRRQKQEREMAKFTEKRLMIPSTHTSNVSIPVSLVYYDFKDRNFPRPAFVSAYGAYGSMTSGEYDPYVVLPLLHRGLIFVLVHPRGDGVLGPRWYRDGKSKNKTNTFYDVEDALLYLKQSGMVKPEGCAIEGRSAGGLVSGWIANRWGEMTFDMGDDSSIYDGHGNEGYKGNIVRDMVKAVLAQVPFMDVISGMADKDIPWVEYEWAEWGNPIESVEIYETMKKYSPYDRIRTQPYPAMMIMGGLKDSRVMSAEPLKYVAKLRSVDGKTNDCQEQKKKPGDGGDKGGSSDNEGNGDEDGSDDTEKKPKRHVNDRMCDGKGETPLLLQIEDGGHFSGSSALWMAFALAQLEASKVQTPQTMV
ncbi:hypothetical protein BGW41_000741 [Actinomortierella wolfii]|nr:hypothetical protein BGW41_000741 [Actinomortierella wolfii]